ncbi:MAG: cytidine deaminase [Pseudomonadota bacterium]
MIERAIEASHHAYVPYSRFHVGACVEMKDGRSIASANVENASYGLTICAETNAITSLIGAGRSAISFIAVVGWSAHDPQARVFASPCGRCRQVIAEFADEDTQLIIAYMDGHIGLRTTAAALLPHPFRLLDE